MAMILEVLDERSGALRTRIRLDGLPFTIGRALDNDLVLDDAYADARHARLIAAEDGGLVLEDLGSVNRILLPRSGQRTDHLPIAPGTEVRLGRTLLRFRDAAEPVPPALKDPVASVPRGMRWLGTGWGRLAVTAAALLMAGFWVWMESYERTSTNDAFLAALGIGMMGALWAGIWAIAGRIVVQRFEFLGHLAIFSAFIVAGLLYSEATSWLEFLFPANWVSTPIAIVVALGGIAVLVSAHLSLAAPLSRELRWRTAIVASLVICGVGAAALMIEDDSFSDVPEFSGVLKPIGARWVPSVSTTEFAGVAADLRDDVDELVESGDDQPPD